LHGSAIPVFLHSGWSSLKLDSGSGPARYDVGKTRGSMRKAGRLKEKGRSRMFSRKTFRRCLIIGLSIWLTACGGSSGSSGSGSDGEDDRVTLKDLDGSWTSSCFVEAPNSLIIAITFDNSTVKVEETVYGDLVCNLVMMMEPPVTSTIDLGDTITVDGSVAGITSATKLDVTITSGPNTGTTEYDLVAIKDDKMYLGDNSGANDGSTLAKRPTQLDADIAFIRK
jgi:hypothetical protein